MRQPSEYDQRQLFLLAKQVEGFDEGSLQLGELIHRSDALLGCLQEVDPEFSNKYNSLLEDLECHYTISLDNEGADIENKHRAELRPTLDDMKRLLAEAGAPSVP